MSVAPGDSLPQKPRFGIVLATLILTGFCLLGPTNGIGSNMLDVSALTILMMEPQIRQRWWQALRPMIGAALPFLLVMGGMAFSTRHGLKAGWATLNGLLFTLLAYYLSSVSTTSLRIAARVTLLVVAVLAAVLLVYNIHVFGWADIMRFDGLHATVNRNRIAVGLGLGFLLGLCNLRHESTLPWRVATAVAVILIAVVSYYDNSRGAMLAMALGSAALTLRWNWKATLLGAGLLATLAAVVVCIHGQPDAAQFSHGGSIDNGRYAIWQVVWQRITQSPWIGYGLDPMNFDPYLNSHFPELMKGHPHSAYLEMIYASGFVGLVFWVVWYVWLGRVARRAPVLNGDFLPALGIAWLCYMAVHASVDFAFYSLLLAGIMSFSLVLATARSGQNIRH